MRRKSGNIKRIAAALACTAMLAQVCPDVRAVGLDAFAQEESSYAYETGQTEEISQARGAATEAETGVAETKAGAAETAQTKATETGAADTKTTETKAAEAGAAEKISEFTEQVFQTEKTDYTEKTDHTAQPKETQEEKTQESIQPESETKYVQNGPEDFQETGKREILTAGNGAVEIAVRRQDGTEFPDDYRVWLISPEDAAMKDQEEAARIREMFKNDWKKELDDNIKGFLAYYIQITDKSAAAVQEDVRVTFIIRDQEFVAGGAAGNDCYVGIHQADEPLKIVESTYSSAPAFAGTVEIAVDISQSGWISIVQTEPAAASDGGSGEEISGESEGTRSQAGAQTEAQAGAQTQTQAEAQAETQTEAQAGAQAETQTEELQTEEVPAQAEVKAAAPSGTRLPAGAYKGVTSGMKASAEYNGIVFRKGISAMELFGSESAGLISGDLGKALYWQPKNENQKGVCGAVYKKVLYNNQNHQWYDVRITLHSYTESVTASDGKAHTCYPYAGFYKNLFGFSFYRAGLFVLKCEIINSSNQAKEAVKFRLNITDIDDYQICAFKLGNGKIDARYCMGDSVVYLETNASVAGIGGFEKLTGADGTIDGSDHRGDVIYDINSSEFYLGIGYGNNNKVSWSGTIKPRYDSALAGTLTGNYGYLGILAQSTILPIDIPAPAKQVSNDGSNWSAQNVLPSVSGQYWYRIEQFVPDETAANYYSKFIFTDQLPPGADYAGGISVIRTEDGKNVSEWFACSAKNNVVTASALTDVLSDSNFYGYHYMLKFAVKMDASKISPVVSGNAAVYSLKNTASVTAAHKTDGKDTAKNSPQVVTTASVDRSEMPEPLKRLDGSTSAAEKSLTKKSEEIVFTVWQSFPACISQLAPKNILVTDVLEDCLEYTGFKAYRTTDFKEFTENTELFTVRENGQTLVLAGKPGIGLNNITLRFDIRCRIKAGYDLSKYEKDGFYVISNRAGVRIEYGYGDPEAAEKMTNEVTVKLEAPPPDVFLEITKEIDAEDIVLAHGNPVFIFRAEGTDVKGERHTYFQPVEFTAGNESAGGKRRMTAVMKVKAGRYTVTEERTMRYAFGGIHSVVGGTVSGESVVFDVSDAKGGSAVFYNIKTTDELQSHTALVQNHFGKK